MKHCPVLMARLHTLGTAQEAGGHRCFYRQRLCEEDVDVALEERVKARLVCLSAGNALKKMFPIAQPTARSSPTLSLTQMSRSVTWQCDGVASLPTPAVILAKPHIWISLLKCSQNYLISEIENIKQTLF